MSLLSRFANLFRGRSLDREFDDELRFHLEMRTDANVRSGMERMEAAAEARRHLGAPSRAREGMREARVIHWLDTLWRDLVYGARVFRRNPGTALVATVMLSLGIGANAVMFSVLYAALFRPLPFPDADRLVAILDRFQNNGRVTGGPPTVPELLDLRSSTEDFETTFYDTRDFQINGGNEPARVFAARVDASFFSVLGVGPQHGRLFGESERAPGSDRAVVLSDGLWRRNFGGDPSVVGKPIVVNAATSTVVGILPPGFSFDYLVAEPIEMFVPFPMTSTYTSRTAEFANVRRVTALARLEPGVTPERTRTELQAFSQRLASEHPDLYRRGSDGQDLGFFMDVEPLRQTVISGATPVLMLLVGAVALVLLIACANTAQFLVARAISREHEVAVRSALGATRPRLARQFLTEALVLALAAGALGLLQTMWLTDAVVALLPPATPIAGASGVNRVVLLCTTGLALTTALVFGLLPAWRFSMAPPGLHLEGRGVTSRGRSRHLLIGLEVAVSVVLLVGAGVLVQSIRELLNTPRGYSEVDVTTLRMRISGRAGRLPHTGLAYQQYLEKITAVPGVAAAAVSDALLPRGSGLEFVVDGRGDDAATLSRQQASYQIVSPDYFSVLGIPLKEGRSFRNDDVADRPPVAIVNETMARAFWPGQTAIGQRIRAGNGPRNALMTIVGVVGNVRAGLERDTPSQIYVSYLQQSEPSINLLVKSAPGAAVSPILIKQAIWSAFPDQPVFSIRPLAEAVSQWSAWPRTVARLLTIFAMLALLMSAAGVYTVVSYLVSTRVKEIALRRAIGAGTLDVVRLLAGETLGWSLGGLAVGMVGAVAARGALSAALGGTVTDLNAGTAAAIAAGYLLVVTASMSVPAMRALRFDPAAVLRSE